MVRVARVEPGGLAAEVGIVVGTELRSVNGRAVADFLDWEFLTAEEELVIEARLPDGEELVLEIERDGGDQFGLALEPPGIRRCANRCEFCFIEGLPKGLRRSLYVRDDDYRLSFAYGNFATLSNVRERDIARILEYRLSPLYVSVHATNWEARKVLLNNRKVPDIVAQLRALADGGIRFHCQMVIVPGMNDGAILEESLSDLWNLGEAVITAAVVPVGLTQFSHLYTGQTMDAAKAGSLLDHVERWGERARRERRETWVFGSDELYMLAGRELPDVEHYGDFAQIENGVGAVTALRERFAGGLPRVQKYPGAKIGVVTGAAMAALMPPLLDRLAAATEATFELIRVENSLFGPTTTTAGLLVGADIRRALGTRTDLDAALIPAETLNDERIFLDDDTFAAVEAALPMAVHPSYDFIDVLELEDVLTRGPRVAEAA
jgi:putative radical SAM enzyme (TIGR03279 family)